MLAFDRAGTGPPLLLLHGTNSSRAVWDPVMAALIPHHEVIRVDLPAHGQSPATSLAPPQWALEVADFMDQLGLGRVSVAGHSSGGWTALELGKLGRVGAVLALTPAGLWRHHSPPLTDLGLVLTWGLGQALGDAGLRPLRTRLGRRLTLAQVSARPAEVPSDVAVQTGRTARASKNFPQHFRHTRVQRFLDGRRISPETPVRVVWGATDRLAPVRSSRLADELPAHAQVETWPDCGHMVMWDAPGRLVAAALSLPPA